MKGLQLFDEYKFTKPLRLIELFAGYGSQALALSNLGVKFEHYRVVEFDKYAIQSYNALHGTDFDTQDITTFNDLGVVDTDEYDYLLTYSFPCTDLSLAGKGEGMKKGTRSGLLWEVERLLKNANELPQVLVMENVPMIHSKKHIDDFNEWIRFLANLGYSNQWEDMNAKNYGVPQNRDRTFMVSILGDYEYHFPNTIELKLRLKDMLEDGVDEKYYLSEKAINGMLKTTYESGKIENRVQDVEGLSSTLCARDYKDPKCVVVGSVDIGNNESNNRVYSVEGVSPTLNTMQGGHRQPKIIMPEATIKGYAEAYEGDGVYINRPHQKRGVVQNGMIQTLTTSWGDFGVVTPDMKIRKLTPRECLRLMGLNDNQIDKIQSTGISNSQMYKQAGNSIVVQVLEAIFKELI